MQDCLKSPFEEADAERSKADKIQSLKVRIAYAEGARDAANESIDRLTAELRELEGGEHMCPCECGNTFETAVLSLMAMGDTREQAIKFLNEY